MTPEEFIIKKINPKSGNLKTGIMNNEYAAELMLEYAQIYHKNQVNNPDKSTQLNEFQIGFKAGWNAALISTERKISEMKNFFPVK